MFHVDIDIGWRFQREDGSSLRVTLGLLNDIRTSGNIATAARQSGLSYRHCWSLIEKWGVFFGAPLVERNRGRGSSLTPLGEQLVWAGQRLQARLGPQLQNLSQELETEINRLAVSEPSIVRIHASHGFAVSKLREMVGNDSGIVLDLRYVNNPNSLASLAHNGCDLAGMHLPQGILRKRGVAAARKWIDPSTHRVVSFVTREMGLIVKRGNPLGVRSLEMLADARVRFVNRDPDSGTRLLFDQLLSETQLSGADINGYEQFEFTHAAVAAYVASDMADVSFGVEAAARQFDLDFVRMATEDYFFVGNQSTLERPSVQRVLDIMKGEEFRTAVNQIPGYAAIDAGEIKSIRAAFR